MDLLPAVLAWFSQPSQWQGSDGIPSRVLEHIQVSGLALLIAAAIGIPIGVLLGHSGKAGFLAQNVANIGRAVPSMAILALVLPLAFGLGLGLGFWPTLMAMVPLGLPPILTNSYFAIRQVDADIVEAARGMGMTEARVLREIELPVGTPLIIAGVRNAGVAIVATATLGAWVAGGGLGRYIVDGFANFQYERVMAGALLVSLLAISTELAFDGLERLLVPEQLRRIRARGGPPQIV